VVSVHAALARQIFRIGRLEEHYASQHESRDDDPRCRRPLSHRRSLLRQELAGVPLVSCCEGVVGDGTALFQQAVAARHEGIVAKNLTSRYRPNRRAVSWRKIKLKMQMPCVVIGYRASRGALRDVVLATLVNGALTYAGVVELGIPNAPSTLMGLQSRQIKKPAVACPLSARWVAPEIFCTVHFCGWRPAGPWRDAVIARWDE
jgi:ATP-dependent DNA ligase